MNKALGIIDAQRGFMPQAEGERLKVAGFGELPIDGGDLIVPNVNKLLGAFSLSGLVTFTTQDWHPKDTAHFADQPNFKTTWPIHCVANTPGALLHPEIVVPKETSHFLKGTEILVRGEDDRSYSGFYGVNEKGHRLDAWLSRYYITEVTLGGLALDYCVAATAKDLRNTVGVDVIVAIDATKGISDVSIKETLDFFKQHGIETASTQEVIDQL